MNIYYHVHGYGLNGGLLWAIRTRNRQEANAAYARYMESNCIHLAFIKATDNGQPIELARWEKRTVNPDRTARHRAGHYRIGLSKGRYEH